MSGSTSSGVGPHFMQKVLDNQWLMLVLANLVPLVLYTLWGVWDVINVPPAP